MLTQPGSTPKFVSPSGSSSVNSSSCLRNFCSVASIVLQVAPKATILPLRVLGPNGEGDTLQVANADSGIESVADFEGKDYDNWIADGKAFGAGAQFAAVVLHPRPPRGVDVGDGQPDVGRLVEDLDRHLAKPVGDPRQMRGRLSREQLDFVELLVKYRGNIQKLAAELDIAYNTARSRMDDMNASRDVSFTAATGRVTGAVFREQEER